MRKALFVAILIFGIHLPDAYAQYEAPKAFAREFLSALDRMDATLSYQQVVDYFAPDGKLEVMTKKEQGEDIHFILERNEIGLLLEEVLKVPGRQTSRVMVGEMDFSQWEAKEVIRVQFESQVKRKGEVVRESTIDYYLDLVSVGDGYKIQRLFLDEKLKMATNTFCICNVDVIPSQNRETIIMAKVLLPGGLLSYVEAHIFRFIPDEGGVFIDVEGQRFFWAQREVLYEVEKNNKYGKKMGAAANRTQAVYMILEKYLHPEQCISVVSENANALVKKGDE